MQKYLHQHVFIDLICTTQNLIKCAITARCKHSLSVFHCVCCFALFSFLFYFFIIIFFVLLQFWNRDLFHPFSLIHCRVFCSSVMARFFGVVVFYLPRLKQTRYIQVYYIQSLQKSMQEKHFYMKNATCGKTMKETRKRSQYFCWCCVWKTFSVSTRCYFLFFFSFLQVLVSLFLYRHCLFILNHFFVFFKKNCVIIVAAAANFIWMVCNYILF